MNTKLTFYCTHIQYGSFEKIIFETIIPDYFKDLYDAKDWLDDSKIDEIYYNFGLDLVFDWVIIDHKKTNESLSDVNIVKTIPGKLVFEDEYESNENEIEKLKSDIDNIKKHIDKLKKEKSKESKKEYHSAWIDPSGKKYVVGFAQHNEFAAHWLKINDPKEYQKDTNKYYYELLENKGWIRILGWTNPPSFSINTVSPKQKNALRDYCTSEKVSYEFWPEILKS